TPPAAAMIIKSTADQTLSSTQSTAESPILVRCYRIPTGLVTSADIETIPEEAPTIRSAGLDALGVLGFFLFAMCASLLARVAPRQVDNPPQFGSDRATQ